MSATMKINVDAGTTFRMGLVPAYGEDMEPEDITGSTFVLRLWYQDSYSHTYPTTIDDGRIIIELSPTETAQLRPHRRYLYAVDWTLPNGDVKRLLEGPLYVNGKAAW